MSATSAVLLLAVTKLDARLRARTPRKFAGSFIDFREIARLSRLQSGVVLLKDFMEQNEITCARLSEQSGVSMRTIALLRRGSSPQLVTAQVLANAATILVGRPVAITDLFDVEVRA